MKRPLPIRWTLAGVIATLALSAGASWAAGALGGLLDRSARSREQFLPVEQAFRVSAVAAGPRQVRITWVIAPGYYLYQKRLKFAAATPGVQLGAAQLPQGQAHTDEYFGTQTVYRGVLEAVVSLERSAASKGPLALSVGYQGCADAGLCYPPQTRQLTLELPRAAP